MLPVVFPLSEAIVGKTSSGRNEGVGVRVGLSLSGVGEGSGKTKEFGLYFLPQLKPMRRNAIPDKMNKKITVPLAIVVSDLKLVVSGLAGNIIKLLTNSH